MPTPACVCPLIGVWRCWSSRKCITVGAGGMSSVRHRGLQGGADRLDHQLLFAQILSTASSASPQAVPASASVCTLPSRKASRRSGVAPQNKPLAVPMAKTVDSRCWFSRRRSSAAPTRSSASDSRRLRDRTSLWTSPLAMACSAASTRSCQARCASVGSARCPTTGRCGSPGSAASSACQRYGTRRLAHGRRETGTQCTTVVIEDDGSNPELGVRQHVGAIVIEGKADAGEGLEIGATCVVQPLLGNAVEGRLQRGEAGGPAEVQTTARPRPRRWLPESACDQ